MNKPITIFEEGQVLLIDKPREWTSFDVVKKIRNTIRIKKVGHAGTLDPLATGLLIVCTGKFTKRIDTYQAQEKEYTGTIVIGKTTASFDLETEIVEVGDVSHITTEDIKNAAQQLTGELQQIPPMFSAVKIDGKRAYLYARKDQEVEMKPRAITVNVFEITRVELPEIDFRIVCSKGTYIRSLARDLGELLNTGAYLSALRRTRIGEFTVDNAEQLDEFVTKVKATQV